MSRPQGGPPRLARALLEALLPAADVGAATGDLDEEYHRFALPSRGRRGADRWYWRQVLLSAPRLAGLRLLGASRGLSLGTMASDLRFAFRVLRRRPGFTVATVATLGLGLGVNTTVFSVVHAVLVRPLPFADVDRLVRPLPDEIVFLNAREAALLGERMTTFEALAPWGRTLFLFTEGGEAEEVRGARVSWNYFDVLGVQPMIGRSFEREDAASDDAIILSHRLWVRRFGADPSVVGRDVDLYGRRVVIIGVMGPEHVPTEFDWEAWRTLPLDPEQSAGMGMAANARLRPGVSIEQSEDEFRRVLPAIWEEGGYVATEEERASMEIAPLADWLIGDARSALTVLAAAVGFVLLLACANVSNLMLAQGGSREREFAVRSALGGSLGRVARQRIVEVLLLSLAGGAVALMASALTLGWFTARLPEDLPRAGDVSISLTVVGFTVACALLTAMLTGLIPVLRSTRGGTAALTGTARGASAGPERQRVRSALVAVEMALAVVLAVGAGLMVRTLTSLRAVDPGFETAGVVTARPSPPSTRYPPGPELDAYYEEVTQALVGVPGVTSVGAIQFLPMTSGGWWSSYRVEEVDPVADEGRRNTAMRAVRGDYFEAMRISVLDGRVFESADGADEAPRVAVVNETFAREAFGGGSPVGRSIWMDDEAVEIVGTVADVRQSDLRTSSHAEMYVPFGKAPWQRMHMVVRTDADENATLAAVGAAIRSVDPSIALSGPRPMDEVVGSTFRSTTLITALLALFGLVGLALGAVGVYGVTAQTVAERRREIGIRIALGAESGGVARRTVLQGMRPVVAGVVLGIAGAGLGARLLEGLLFGVQAIDPGTFATAPAVLILTALGALAVPASRASHVDPVRMLREE